MLVDKKKSRDSEIPTSSLADIAFLLLIFFLVTTTIDVDKGIGLALPPKGETKEVHKKNIANLLINEQGEALLDNQPIQINMLNLDGNLFKKFAYLICQITKKLMR